MAESREDETLAALQAMRAGAAPSSPSSEENEEVYAVGPVPEPPKFRAPALPPSGPPSSADHSPRPAKSRVIGEEAESPRCCLHCGYLLGPSGAGRCSECGKQFAEGVLERWFGGYEQGRLEKVRWLLAAMLFAKVWFWMPHVGNYANFIATLIAFFTIYIANEEKSDSLAGLYALGAGVASALGVCLATSRGVTPYYYFVDLAVAGLLLAVILTDNERFEILGRFSMKTYAFVMLFAAPVLGVALNAASAAATAAGGSTALIDGIALSVPFAMNLVGWGFVLWCVHFIYRTLFVPDVLDES